MREKTINSALAIILPLLLVIAAGSCSVSKPPAIDPNDIAYIYNPLTNPINPAIKVFNESGNRSSLIIRLNTGDLFFSEANPEGQPLASLTITARLYDDTQGGILADTVMIRSQINRNQVEDKVLIELPLTTYDGNEYTVELRVMDNINRRVVQSFTRFDRLSLNSRYNFRLRHHQSASEIFSPIVTRYDLVDLVYPGRQIDTLFVFLFGYFDEIPYPPSMMLPEKTVRREADSIIRVALSDNVPLLFPNKGIYLCSIDSAVAEGYTLFNFGDEYPMFSQAESMIEPLAYIAGSEEMAAMRSAEKAKIAVDEFWLARSSNIEKSRELLRIYYNRVMYSNYFFTSYKEGWRTDRGMIYIMYGPPDKVYKNREGEQWGYRKPVIKKSWGLHYKVKDEYLWFNFRNIPNRFSSEDYYLSRSDATPTYWDKAVSDWRKGIVFRLDNPDDL